MGRPRRPRPMTATRATARTRSPCGRAVIRSDPDVGFGGGAGSRSWDFHLRPPGGTARGIRATLGGRLQPREGGCHDSRRRPRTGRGCPGSVVGRRLAPAGGAVLGVRPQGETATETHAERARVLNRNDPSGCPEPRNGPDRQRPTVTRSRVVDDWPVDGAPTDAAEPLQGTNAPSTVSTDPVRQSACPWLRMFCRRVLRDPWPVWHLTRVHLPILQGGRSSAIPLRDEIHAKSAARRSSTPPGLDDNHASNQGRPEQRRVGDSRPSRSRSTLTTANSTGGGTFLVTEPPTGPPTESPLHREGLGTAARRGGGGHLVPGRAK